MRKHLVTLIQEMPRFAAAFLIAVCLALPFNANADFWRDFRDSVKDTLKTIPTGRPAGGGNESPRIPSRDGGSTFTSATPVAVGEVIRSYLDERENEYFRFTPANDATYVIYSRGPTDTNAGLYNERFSNMGNDFGSGEDGNFRIAARLQAGFTYYILVQGRPGPYELHIEGPEGATKSDDHGFSSWSATPIEAGNIKEGRIDTSNDQDYFRLVPRENDTYVIFTRGQTSTQGTLYDEAFNTIAHDMYSPQGEDRNFRIAHRLEAGHTYYILVRGKPGLYRLHVEGPEGATRSDDHGFSSWSATTIRPGSVTEGVLDVMNDQDYFRFIPEQDGAYVIYTRGSTANPNGTLYDEAFNQLKNHHAVSKDGAYFRIEHFLNAGRTYFILVRGGKGPYTLNVDGPENRYSDAEVNVDTATVSRCRSSEITTLARASLKDKAAGVTFGYLCEPYIHTGLGLYAHAGIDLKAAEGTPVYAIASGDVVAVDRQSLGKLMIKLPDGKRLIYLHLSRIDVREDQSVSSGDPLGLSGSKGANSPHLHIEVRKNYNGKFALGGDSCGGECTAAQVAEKTVDPAVAVGR
jgi:hypothetical protein